MGCKQQTSRGKKIKIISVDTSRPFYNSDVTKEDYIDYNRNKIYSRDYDMANNIEKHIKTSEDKRNCLFIVGYIHAYRLEAERIESHNVADKRNCASILSDKFQKNNIFSIITHSPIVTN